MAEKKINSEIEFAYSGENIFENLKYELEKNFLYQNIIIVDTFYEYGANIEKMIKDVKCNFFVCRNIENYKNFDDYACIIIINNSQIEKVKIACTKNKIPYILVLTKTLSEIDFSNKILIDYKTFECFKPIGIFIDKTQIKNQKDFICDASLEMSSLSFNILELKFNNIFYGKTLDYQLLNDCENIMQKLKQTLSKNSSSIENIYDKIAGLYMDYITKIATRQLNTLDRVTYLFLESNASEQRAAIETKYYYQLIIISLFKNYFKYFTTQLANVKNYALHTKYLNEIGAKYNFQIESLPNNKIEFLLSCFRNKMYNLSVEADNDVQLIREQLADIDVNYLFKSSIKISKYSLTNYICLEPDIFGESNFLNLMSQNGLLNFNI